MAGASSNCASSDFMCCMCLNALHRCSDKRLWFQLLDFLSYKSDYFTRWYIYKRWEGNRPRGGSHCGDVPGEFLKITAQACGVIRRERKIDPVILFWVLTLGFGVRFLSTIRGLKRKYEEKASVKLSMSSFYGRFTPKISFRGACSCDWVSTRSCLGR